MNLENINWEKEYNKFIEYLFSLQDIKYKEFHFKLLNNDKINLIGIRTPILKKFSKEISKGNYGKFIENNKHKYYEEIILHGLLIGNLKDINLLDEFLKYIDNWAINDIVASNMKYFKYNQEEGLVYIKKYILNSNPWIVRFGYVLLLDYYVNDTYIDEVINLIKCIKSNDYYVNMAVAWLISVCFIKYKDKIMDLFNENKLNKFIINKSISKINDSNRVSKSDKDLMKKYKMD